jgi:hypothetical protein
MLHSPRAMSLPPGRALPRSTTWQDVQTAKVHQSCANSRNTILDKNQEFVAVQKSVAVQRDAVRRLLRRDTQAAP